MSVTIDYSSGFFEVSPSGDTVGTVTGNATLDLSTGSVFSHTPTANTTFAFSNPPASGTASSATLKLTGANVTSGYDIANLSVTATTDQFDATGPSNLEQDMIIRDNGTDIFILDYYGIIWHYTLATAFDVNSTATLVRSLDVKGATGTGFSASASDFRGFTITPDGTQVVVRGDDPSIVLRQFSLATAWDLSSTKTLVGSYTGISSVSGATDSRGIKFANSGTLATLGGNNVDRRFAILELSTAYDITSVSSSTTYNLNTDFGYTTRTNYWVWGSQYSNDGMKLIITSVYGYEIVVVDLATAYDPSSYTGISELQSSQDIASLSFTSDGGKAVVVRNTTAGDIRSYTSGSAALATITYPSSVIWSGGTTPTAPADGETDVYTFYTDDGGTTYYGFQAGDAVS